MADTDAFDDDAADANGESQPLGESDGDEDAADEPLILIVVGAHLRAEVGDRPLAYKLRDRMVQWLDARFPPPPPPSSPSAAAPPHAHPYEVLVCTDVWYLNDAGLRVWPTVSVGGPGVNALSAFLGDKLPSVLVVDDVLMIQMDPDLRELTAAIWGVNHDATVSAIDAFIDRYLPQFMEAATKAFTQGAEGGQADEP